MATPNLERQSKVRINIPRLYGLLCGRGIPFAMTHHRGKRVLFSLACLWGERESKKKGQEKVRDLASKTLHAQRAKATCFEMLFFESQQCQESFK